MLKWAKPFGHCPSICAAYLSNMPLPIHRQLNQGFFPDIDFAITTPGDGPQLRASVKTVNTFTKGYEKQLTETLPEHVDTIITSTQNDIKAGRRPAVTTIDIRVPPGSAIPKTDLINTLRDRVPKDLQKYIKIMVNEF